MNKSRTLWPKVPAAFVEKNLTGHKILGLATAALLYLVCLSGAVTVFYIDIERWENAGLAEVHDFKPEAIAIAFADMRRHIPKDNKEIALYAVTPTPDYPRLVLSLGETQVRAYDENGQYSGPAEHPATHGLTELHAQLHLPETLGLIIVGLSGVAMLALILGGLLAHPRILKDAFLWRLNGTPRTNRADLHNRIGVWASPFHIVIAFTGALIGLSQVLVVMTALVFYKGDTVRAMAPIYPDIASKSIDGQISGEAIVRALTTLKARHPEATVNFIALNNVGTDHEALNVSAEIKDRLVYGDSWEFDGKGNLVGQLHLADGAAGKQIYASLYRLHFGNFGGLWIRWAYLFLGLGLSLICTTGIDIWLLKSAQKGRSYPRLHKVWTGFVWATPAAMAIATLMTVSARVPFAAVFWGLTVVLSLAALRVSSQPLVSKIGRYVCVASLLAVVGGHILRYGAAAFGPAALGPNLTLLAAAALLLALTARKSRPKTNSPAGETAL